MAFKKKSKKKAAKEEVTSFSTSDFSVKAVTSDVTVNVAGVTGTSNYAATTNYTAYVSGTYSEADASLSAVLAAEVTSAGHSLAIATTLPVSITTASAGQTISNEVTTISTATSGLTASGTLSVVEGLSAYRPYSISMDVSAGAFTLSEDPDIGVGILSAAGLPVSGTITALSGAWTLDFTNQEILTDATAITKGYEITYPYEVVSTPIVISHTVVDGSPFNGTAAATLSAQVIDASGTTSANSSTFTLSANTVSNNNIYKGKGALPGETQAETVARFYVEGII